MNFYLANPNIFFKGGSNPKLEALKQEREEKTRQFLIQVMEAYIVFRPTYQPLFDSPVFQHPSNQFNNLTHRQLINNILDLTFNQSVPTLDEQKDIPLNSIRYEKLTQSYTRSEKAEINIALRLLEKLNLIHIEMDGKLITPKPKCLLIYHDKPQ